MKRLVGITKVGTLGDHKAPEKLNLEAGESEQEDGYSEHGGKNYKPRNALIF